MREEIFGPVVAACSASDELDEVVVKAANDTSFGPGASVLDSDLEPDAQACRAHQTGTVWGQSPVTF